MGAMTEGHFADFFDAAVETMPRERLAELQLARLRETVRNAHDHVPLHRGRLEAAGVAAGDLRTLDDVKHLPFTMKTDLRDTYPFGMFARPLGQVTRLHASSGTTGKPTVVGYTRSDLDNWADLMARSMYVGGARPGGVVHNSYGYGLFTGGLGAHYGAERLGCTVIPMSGGQTEKQVQLIRDLQPDVIMVTPSYMQVIVEEFERQGLDPRASSLKVGIFGAEPWTESMRRDIEARAGLDAVDIYGLSEVLGPGVASECIESKDGPVVWEDHFYPEIIDPLTGAVLPDGSEGELVFTSLTKEALPIVRYRTRDLTRLLPPTSRSFRRIAKIVGRSDDMLIIRGVNVFPSQIEEIVLQHERLSGQYQLVVTRDGHLDQLEVVCELQRGAPASDNDMQSIAGWLQQRIKVMVGVSTTVAVRPPESIERTLTGKARRVFDKRPK
jgi:phenylacetate-CoA ligase